MTVLEELESHAIYTNIENLVASINSLKDDPEFVPSMGKYGLQTFERCSSLVNQIQIRLDLIEPLLVRKSTLDAVNNELTVINAALSNYKVHFTNTNNLNNINSKIETILAHMTSLYYLNDLQSIAGIRENVISFRRTVGQHRALLLNKQKEFNEKHAEIVQKAEALEPFIEETEEKFESLFSKVNDYYSGIQDEISIKEESRVQEFNEKFEEVIEQFFKNAEDSQDEYNKILEEHQKSVELLVGDISTSSISGHFKEVADKKEKSIKIWNILTVGGFAATIAFGIYAFIFSEGTEWTSLIAKLIVTAAIGSFTAYAARQVTKNEEKENYHRQMEVELKTLNPYIAAFQDTEKIRLKEQLFPQIFGRAEMKKGLSNESPSLNLNHFSEEEQILLLKAIDIVKNATSVTDRSNL